MSRLLFAASLVLSSGLAVAAEPVKPAPKKPDLVHPAAYRIRVEYDQRTLDEIRGDIREEVTKALEARRRRLRLSRKEMEAHLRKELRRYEKELEGVKEAEREERTARERGDLAGAEKWRHLRAERMRRALELAERTRLVEQALLALSLDNWRIEKRKERVIAAKALDRLETLLDEIHKAEEAERRERGPGVAPPHE